MSSALAPEMLCPACGSESVSGYVQFGSYGVQCFVCPWQGPVTSWIAIASRLPDKVRAVLVDQTGSTVRFIAEGSGANIRDAVSRASADGSVVRLFSGDADA